MNITPEAREAAQNEFSSANHRKHKLARPLPLGFYVQFAINAAVAEKDKEIERLKLMCADHATSQAIAESEVVQMSYKCAGIKEQLTELREIAEGLAKLNHEHRPSCSLGISPSYICDCGNDDMLTRYTQWKEKGEK